MPQRKRSRTVASSSTGAILLDGGHAHPPRTVQKFRDGNLCDVELQAADGTAYRAHTLCLTAGSAYFEAIYARNDWKDASGPLILSEVPAHALAVCLEFIYAGEATVTSEAELSAVLELAAYLQMPELVEAASDAAAARLCPETALRTWEVADRQGGCRLTGK